MAVGAFSCLTNTSLFISISICLDNKLHDAAEEAENKQLHFKVEAERLKHENLELQVKLESG